MKLVLFDVDGTILRSGGAGKRALDLALQEIFGSVGPQSYMFDGRTDPEIVRDLMRHDGHDDAVIDARMESVFDRYLDQLHHELAQPSCQSVACDGVTELLDALERCDEVIMGLLTGNHERGAVAKLRAVGIDPARFRVGAYGSDHERRTELPAIARQRAHALADREIPGADVYVIGDTPADIACGRGIGARAIAVATGRYDVAALASHRPHAVFPNLRDVPAVLAALELA